MHSRLLKPPVGIGLIWLGLKLGLGYSLTDLISAKVLLREKCFKYAETSQTICVLYASIALRNSLVWVNINVTKIRVIKRSISFHYTNLEDILDLLVYLTETERQLILILGFLSVFLSEFHFYKSSISIKSLTYIRSIGACILNLNYTEFPPEGWCWEPVKSQ